MTTTAWQTFDDQAAAAATGGAAFLPPELQRHGVTWPSPAEHVSDHSAEGAPWQPAPGTRNQPTVPPLGPMWRADHDGPSYPATSDRNQAEAAVRGHDGHQLPQAYPAGRPNIGRPFVIEVTRFLRHLATDLWDPTGKRISPPDAPSAPVQIYGSEHDTTPRQVPYEVTPLFGWAWPAGPRFSRNPGYLGVSASVPDTSARPQGAVAARPPSDPQVAQAAPSAGPLAIDYDLGI